ncbi:bestrophin family ion channel [Flavobacterium cerinum]|uniref:Multidrug transporter n=1 Tax=Flavobacterium cerinum TaxID=2502784 RepID=A0ABY5INK6_9FLAO|nr:bestrophin family ion channel [Flavobacterium cerinum]UUC44380.1 hypothetical protein NOX80_12125 [Flavobacterium cerinum]
MHTKRNKTQNEKFILWPKNIGYILIIWSVVQTLLYQYFNLKWIALPWTPIAAIGILSLLLFSLKNKQIQRHRIQTEVLWKTIVRSSSTWNNFLQNNFNLNAETYEELKNRHLAWLVVLRYQLNKERDELALNESAKIQDELSRLISQSEMDYIAQHKNSAKQLVALQSKRIKELFDQGIIENQQYLTLLGHLADYYDLQLRCEKNNSYNANSILAKVSLLLVHLFILLLPFGLINEFQKLKPDYVLLTIPLCILISLFFIFTELHAQKANRLFEFKPKQL